MRTTMKKTAMRQAQVRSEVWHRAKSANLSVTPTAAGVNCTFLSRQEQCGSQNYQGEEHQQLISSCWALFWSHCSAVYSEAATLLVPLGNRASSEFPLAAKSGSTMEVEYDGNLISADYPQSVLHNTAKFEHQVDLSTQHARVKLRGLARSSWVQHVSCVQKVLFFWRH